MDQGNSPDADGDFSNAPYFNFNNDKLKFDTNWIDNANDNYGSASAFSPKSLLSKPLPDGGGLGYMFLVARIQPPSIRPISSTSHSSRMYFLLSIVFTSFIKRKKTRRRLNFMLACFSAVSLSC